MEPNMAVAVPLDDAEAIARLYRRLVLLVGLQLVLGIFAQALPAMGNQAIIGFLAIAVLIGLLCILAMLAITAYKLTEHLGAGMPILWAIAMFLPCINIITLLVLSSKAQAWCKRYGIKVGFLGPTSESIEEVRRRTVTSKFE